MKCYWFPVKGVADNFNAVVIFSFVSIRGAGYWLAPFFSRRPPKPENLIRSTDEYIESCF